MTTAMTTDIKTGHKMQNLDEMKRHLQALSCQRPAIKSVLVHEAIGRVMAQDLVAQYALPSFDASAMDGYAVNLAGMEAQLGAADGKTPRLAWQVLGRSQAGEMTDMVLQAGQAWRIFTGAPVPAGADAVIPQELMEPAVREWEGGEWIALQANQALKKGQHIRKAGSEQEAGCLMVQAGQRLSTRHVGQLAAQGIARVDIYRRPIVGVLSTGNELVQAGQALQTGQIYDANRPQLLALVHACGCTPIDLGVVPDDLADTANALLQAAQRCDVIISSGGASVGDADHLRGAVQRVGRLDHWQVAIKPGKPFALGHVQGKPFFGLPGNPVAAFVTFYLLVAPYLRRACGVREQDWEAPSRRFRLTQSLQSGESRRQFLRVQVADGSDGLRLCPDQGSAALSSLAQADALLEVPENTQLQAGDWATCHLLHS